MPVYFTRARHSELGDVVMPAEALEHCPGWESYGEPSTDPEALRSELALEQAVQAAELASAAQTTAPSAKPKQAPATESSAPVGAEPKEQ